MYIEVDKIGSEGLRVDGPLPAAWHTELTRDLQLPPGRAEVVTALLVERQSYRVHVVGTVEAHLTAACCMCLQPVALSLQLPMDLSVVPETLQPEADAHGELTEEAVSVETYTDDRLDLGRILHDEVLLEVPQRIVCEEDCLGLCSSCGANRNTQPCSCNSNLPTGPFAALANNPPRPTAAKEEA